MESLILRGTPTVGSGDGDGYGYGYGDGDGDGSGDGYGDGSGSGSGSGAGDGYGYGSGDGDGDGDYWLATIDWFATKWGVGQQQRLVTLRLEGARIAFWRSRQDGTPANGGRGMPAYAGKIETVSGPLRICSENALHATVIPPKWKGDRWWIVALIGEVQEEGDKLGALTREIIGECL